jgi:hypothetical protein
MIGLHGDSFLQQKSKRERVVHPQLGHNSGHNRCEKAENSSATSTPNNNAFVQAVQYDSSALKFFERNESDATLRANGVTISQRSRDQSQRLHPTKIILSTNTHTSWKLILRDAVMVFIPIFVLYKISTHPSIASIGNQHSNAPKKYSQRELLEQAMFRLSLIRRRDELLKEYIFLEAMHENKCHDFPSIDIYAQLNQKIGRRDRKFQSTPRKQTKGKPKVGKMNRSRAGHSRTSSSSPPMMSIIWGSLHASMARTTKGAVTRKKIQKAEGHPNGKKGADINKILHDGKMNK